MTLIKNLIDIPEKIFKGDFVLNLADGVTKPKETVQVYVVTPQLTDCFREALRFIRSAIESKSSKAAYLHGSFGSGKSHFMAILYLLLHHDPFARTHKDLEPIIEENAWAEGRKFLMVPYHMIGHKSVESAILDGYVDYAQRHHPDAPLPAVYGSDRLFENAITLRKNMGDDRFFEVLGQGGGSSGWGKKAQGWNAERFEAALQAPPKDRERLRLVSDLVKTHLSAFKDMTGMADAEVHVSLDDGLSIISNHAKDLGYDALILFLDELVLWLASHAGDAGFVEKEAEKVAKLVESGRSDRAVPIVSFVARQRDLRELVGENSTGADQQKLWDALKFWEGRFHTIRLEDRNLPVIAEKRVLKPVSPQASAELDDAFEKTARVRSDIMDVLLTAHGDKKMFRQVYPFSPALVDTLVAVSSVLQRERTALRVMLELLVQQRDTLELGHVIPVGDLFDIVAHGEEAFADDMKRKFDNAKRLYHEKLLPLLEEKHQVILDRDAPMHTGGVRDWDGNGDTELARRVNALRNDDRLVKTLLLSAIVPEVESLKGLTPLRLAALNHGTIRAPIPGQEASMVLRRVEEWAARVGEICVGGEDGSQKIITVQLSGIDTEGILEKAAADDNVGNRRRLVRKMLFEELGIADRDEATFVYEFLWRCTKRSVHVVYAKVRELSDDTLRAVDDNWKIVIDWPFDESGYSVSDGLSRIERFQDQYADRPSRTLLWLPSFLTAPALRDLGKLVRLEHILQSDDRFASNTAHLPLAERTTARTLLDNQRSALRTRIKGYLVAAYGLSTQTDGVDTEVGFTLKDHFQSMLPVLKLRPPAAGAFARALTELLDQALTFQFPGHPAFGLDNEEIKAPKLRKVWLDVQRVAQDPDGRVLVEDKAQRPLLTKIATPLHLGDIPENYLLLNRHWLVHFNKKIAEHRPLRLSVRQLWEWMDDPQPTGLPDLIRSLVVLFFAEKENRSFVLHGKPVAPDVDQVRPEMELVQQKLPEDEIWKTACEQARRLFNVTPPRVLNGANLARIAEDVRAACPALQENLALAKELERFMLLVGIDDAAETPRLRTARDEVEIISAVESAADELQVVQGLAGLKPGASDVALRKSAKSAGENAAELNRTSVDLFKAVAVLQDDRAERGRALLADLREALRQDEQATALIPHLKRAASDAARLLASTPQPPPTPPIQPPPPPPRPNLKKVATDKCQGATVAEVRKLLKALEKHLDDGRLVDLSWTVWERER